MFTSTAAEDGQQNGTDESSVSHDIGEEFDNVIMDRINSFIS